MKTVRNLLIITLPIVLLSLFLLEIILRKWFPVDDPFQHFKERFDKSYIPSQLKPNTRYNFSSDEGIPGLDKRMSFSTNNIGFRGDYLEIIKPLNEIRIFIVGGSTAQCLYIDDTKSIDRVLQNELQKMYPNKLIKVYNAGKSGDASPDHLAILSQRIIHLQPDIVIVFSGFNDLRRSIVNYDYLHITPVRLYSPKYIFLTATDFQIARRLYYLLKQKTVEEIRESVPLETNYKQLFELQRSYPVSDSVPLKNARPYAVNLNSIAGICNASKVRLVFMTNQSTWNSKIDLRVKNNFWLLTVGNITYKEEYLDEGLEQFNDTMRSIALENNIPIFDVSRLLPKSLDYFYDDCHFNIMGAGYTGRLLADFFKTKNLIQSQ